MECEAIVARVEGEYAYLKLSAQPGCGQCASSGGCTSGVLNQLFGPSCRLHKIPNLIGAKPGESVRLLTPDGMIWRAALIAYGLPLLLGLVLAALGAQLGERWSALGLAGGLTLGFFTARRIQASPLWQPFAPRMVKASSTTWVMKEIRE